MSNLWQVEEEPLKYTTRKGLPKKLAIFLHLTKVGCQYSSHLKAVSKESDDLLND